MIKINQYKNWLNTHRWYAVGGAIIIIGGGYWYFKGSAPVAAIQYVTASAQQGTLIATVSGSGQVSASNQIDLKPEASGSVLNVAVHNSDKVTEGQLIASLNAGDALRSVRDAALNLQSARLSLEKLTKQADELSVIQSENSLLSAQDALSKLKLTQETNYQKAIDTKQNSANDIAKAYEDAFNAIASAFLNLPTISSGIYDGLYGKSIGISEPMLNASGQTNDSVLFNTTDLRDQDKIDSFITSARNDVQTSRTKYETNFVDYKNISRYSDTSAIENMLTETIATVKSIAQAAKSESNLFDTWVDLTTKRGTTVFAKVTNLQSTMSSYVNQTNTHLSSLLSIEKTLKDSRDAQKNAERDLVDMQQNNPRDITAAEATIKEKEASLTKLKSGADALDIQSERLSVQQRQLALADAQATLAKYAIRAPIAGTIAKINIKKGDTASAGTAAVTILSDQKIAEITLNEVDVAKIQVGQKVTLTFDAVENVTLNGNVAEIDSIGTVTQGVVSYGVKISFDTTDERIKPGMSVSANIITQVEPDVLMVPTQAIKYQGNAAYVEVLENNKPVQRSIQVGSANDTDTVVTGDLKEGEPVITQTINPTTTVTQSNGGVSGLQLLGGGNRGTSGGGGNFRTGGGGR